MLMRHLGAVGALIHVPTHKRADTKHRYKKKQPFLCIQSALQLSQTRFVTHKLHLLQHSDTTLADIEQIR